MSIIYPDNIKFFLSDLNQKENVDAVLKMYAMMCRDLISLVPVIIVTLGKLGVLIAHCDKTATHLPVKGSRVSVSI